MIHPSPERISLRPFISCPRPTAASLRSDFQAGLTVAIFAVPQALAYAKLAGVPPVNGLYCAVVMAFVASLFGSSPFLNTGPTNTASLLLASVIAPFAARATPETVLPMIWQFTLLVGLMRLALGLLKAGPLVRLVPEHAILGFVTAANLLIALGQFNELLGVKAPQGNTFNKLIVLAQEFPQAQWPALAVGLMTLALMLGFDRFSRRFPVTLCAVIAATLAAWALATWLPLAPHVALVHDIAPIPSGFPFPKVYAPDFDLMLQMLPGAAAVAIIGLLESASISSTLALKNKQTVNFNQEFFGQGVAQIATAFFSGFPGSASYSRSALIERNGGQTMLAGIFFSAMTLLALLIGAQVLGEIPLTALAALLVFTGIKLVDMVALRRVWNFSRADFGVVALTFVVTFFGNLQWGFFAGIVAALLVFVARAKTLQLFELIPGPNNKWEERLYTPNSDHPRSDVVALALHGDLFFGMAHELRGQLGEIVREQEPKWIIVRMRRATSVDASVWNALADFAAAFEESGGQLILCGLSPQMETLIERTEMSDLVPSANLLPREGSAFVAFERGLERIGAQLQPGNVLSAQWSEWAQKHKMRGSVSHWRDPANDPATLGAIELFG